MRYFTWVLRIIIFLILLGFALQNTETVILNGFLGYYWQAPLVFIVLACFSIGALCGVLASLLYIIKLRRQLIALRKMVKAKPSLPKTLIDPIVEPPRDAL